MTLADLISLATARLANLASQRTSAAQIGDVARLTQIDTEIADTEATLAALRSVEG